jgi:hypothetical protein
LQDDWSDGVAWDRFVESHVGARYCQKFGYGRVVACYGCRPRQFAFLRNRTLVGVLLAAGASSILYRRRLVSQPFSDFGGIPLDPGPTAAEVDATRVALRDFLRRNAAVSVMELYGNRGMAPPPESLLETGEAVGQIAATALTSDAGALWENVVGYSVRKAEKPVRNLGAAVYFECDPANFQRDLFPSCLIQRRFPQLDLTIRPRP